MIVFRFLAYLLILAGIGILGHGIVGMLENGGFEPVPFARLWLGIDQSSFSRRQPFPRTEPGDRFPPVGAHPLFLGRCGLRRLPGAGHPALDGVPRRATRAVGIGRRRSGTGAEPFPRVSLKIEYCAILSLRSGQRKKFSQPCYPNGDHRALAERWRCRRSGRGSKRLFRRPCRRRRRSAWTGSTACWIMPISRSAGSMA